MIDVASAVLILAGAFLTLSAGVGLLRFENLLARLHAVAKPQVLGLALLLLGLELRLRSWTSLTMFVLVIAFQLLTAPVAAHLVGRAGVRLGQADPMTYGRDGASGLPLLGMPTQPKEANND